jgi:CheY-like chemotaxis protein
MKQILMIEDVMTNIKCAKEALKNNYELTAAKTGKKALIYLRSNPNPDLILLDINLPDIDGYELLTIIKSDEKTADIPVIFLTAEIDIKSEAKGLTMGAVDYIKKPFGPEILLARIGNVLKNVE